MRNPQKKKKKCRVVSRTLDVHKIIAAEKRPVLLRLMKSGGDPIRGSRLDVQINVGGEGKGGYCNLLSKLFVLEIWKEKNKQK